MNKLLQYLLIITAALCGAVTPVNATPGDAPGLPSTAWLLTSNETVAADYTGFCQDPAGFLWIGTDRGLLRYDGNSFDLYTSDPNEEYSLSDNRVLNLLTDHNGRVWIGTANGLNLYRPETDDFLTITLPSLGFLGYIISMGEQSDGTLLFLVSGQGLYIISDTERGPEAVRYLLGMPEETNMCSLACATDGKVYVATRHGQLSVIERNGQSTLVNVGEGYVQDMVMERDGNLLIADICCVYRYFTDGSGRIEKLESGVPLRFNTLGRCAEGVKAGTDGSGLWCISTGSRHIEPVERIYSPFVNLQDTNIGAVYCSNDGSLWLGCNYKGIVMVPSEGIRFSYRPLSGYFPDFQGGVGALATVGNNTLVAVDNGRLALLSPQGKLMETLTVPGGGRVVSLTPLPGGTVAVGLADRGLLELSLTDGVFRPLVTIEGSYPHIEVAPGRDDELFIAVYGREVLRYNRKTGETMQLPVNPSSDRLTNTYVTSMLRTPDDKVWVSYYSGLGCYDLRGDSLMSIPQAPFLPGASYALARGEGNTVWVGTSHGLVQYDPAKGVVKKLTREDGLADNDIRSVVTDDVGMLWIGTLHGLSQYDPLSGKVLTLAGGYGMVENIFEKLAYTPGNGMMRSAGDLGVTFFSTVDDHAPDLKGGVKITGIYLNGKRLSPSHGFDGDAAMIKGDPMTPESIRLPYRENSLRLRLSMLDYKVGRNLHYCWRLDGDNNAWQELPEGETMVHLPHLDPGNYTLRLKAEENGVESAETRIAIHITPPWYLSIWMKLLYALLGAGVLAMAYVMFMRRRKMRESEERIRCFMDLSHDIRSPMTLILSPLESLIKTTDDPGTRRQLQTMRRNALRILSLVDQMLEIRKLEKGKARLRCRLTDINGFVSQLVEMFGPQAAEMGLAIEFKPAEGLPEIWADRRNLDKILVNLISNALKYTPRGGSITVATGLGKNATTGECIEISVTDTGIGLDPKTESKVFDRFFQGTRPAGAHGGFGIGLDLCRRLTEFHHGVITGRNRRDGVTGSVFTVSLPVDASCYNSEELILKPANEPESSLNQYVIMPGGRDSESADTLHPGNRGRRVLIVDDDRELRDYLAGHFSKRFRVKTAGDGKEALRMIAEETPDIIVTDVKMPGTDGLALLRGIKGNGNLCHIPVILLSSLQEISDRLAGWDRGADGYLGKPFHVDELEAMIDSRIEASLRISSHSASSKSAAPEGAEETAVTGAAEQLMAMLTEKVEQNVGDAGFNVEKLSEAVGLSRTHLHRKMKEHLGMTPSDFIRTVRMRLACRLLLRGDMTVSEVGFKLGYNSHSHFTTVFKNFTGYTPTDYQAMDREKRKSQSPPAP